MSRSSRRGGSRAARGALAFGEQLELPLQIVAASGNVIQFRKKAEESTVPREFSDALRRILQHAEKLPK